MIYLTSFAKSKNLEMPVFSAAVYQPKGYEYQKADWADIRGSDGKWIRPREFIDWTQPLNGYFASLFSLYVFRERKIIRWVREHEDCALLCWCPYGRAAQRQLKEHGTYVCHMAVIEAFLRSRGITVKVDKDRKTKMVRFF